MRTGIVVAGLLVAASVPGVTRAEAARLVLTRNENSLEPQTAFRCDGVIHATLTLPESQRGRHLLESVWTGPMGQVVEHVKVPIDCGQGRRTAYTFIRFDERTLGPLRPFSVGGDNSSLRGKWTVEVRWDGRPVAKNNFDVSCGDATLK